MPKVVSKSVKKSSKPYVTYVYDEDGNQYEIHSEEKPVKKTATKAPKKSATTSAKSSQKKSASTSAKSSQKKSAVTKKTVSKSTSAKKSASTSAKSSNKASAKSSAKSADKSKKVRISAPKKTPKDEELMDYEEMQKKTAKEKEKKYREYKKWIKAYEAEKSQNTWDNLPEWKKADKYMTNAASIRVRFQGLLNADLNNQPHLDKAVQPLRLRGEKSFRDAMEIVERLSPEEAELFWQSQERNRGVTSFDQLVTKKEFDEAQRLVSTAVVQGLDLDDEEEEEEKASEEPKVEEQEQQQQEQTMVDSMPQNTQTEEHQQENVAPMQE